MRQNIATVSDAEQKRFVDAVNKIDTEKLYPDGVSYWDKQDQIHQVTHVHGGPAFVPWHRELCNRFEKLLREVDPDVSLHYWDWTTDPRNSPDGEGGTTDLFTSAFMGSASGRAGDPIDSLDNGGQTGGSRDQTGNPADPPAEITRGVDPGAPSIPSDATIKAAGNALPLEDQWFAFRNALESAHNAVHGYIGGDIAQGHSAFEDPFVFLLHSNVDRLWAEWQAVPGNEWRLDPTTVYGFESDTTGRNGLATPMEPWAGNPSNDPDVDRIRPWMPPDNQQVSKTSKHRSVVKPPCYDTLPESVTLTSPSAGGSVSFQDVSVGALTYRAARFSIESCRTLHFEVSDAPGPGSEFAVASEPQHEVPASPTLKTETRLWFSFQRPTTGSVNDTVTVRCIETGDEWTIALTANAIEPPSVATLPVLDRSGSMTEDSGDGRRTRAGVLRDAATKFVDLLSDEDGIGIVSFTDDAQTEMAVERVAPSGRADALDVTRNYAPEVDALTAIGDGVERAKQLLDGVPPSDYDQNAMIVFTDGFDTAVKGVADVADIVSGNDRVFAVGLGTANQVKPAALNALVDSSGGYLLLTGDFGDDPFMVDKYFLQVLVGATNKQIVEDPTDRLRAETTTRIPFDLNETDNSADVILLSPTSPNLFDFKLETPDGNIIDPGSGMTGIEYTEGDTVGYYRLSLPARVNDEEAQTGTWNAILKLDGDRFRRYRNELEENDIREFDRVNEHGPRYNLSVHSESTLALDARVSQDSYEPGATMTIRASLREGEMPVEHRATLTGELDRPDGTTTTVSLDAVEPGVFETAFHASMAGTYRCRVIAEGKTFRNNNFTREQLVTGSVWRGGDDPLPVGEKSTAQLCDLLDCVVSEEVLGDLLERHEVDADHLRECFKGYCERPQ